MRKLVIAALSLLGTLAAYGQEARVIIYPVEAIVDSANLSKSEFQQRYTGIDATRYGIPDEGWYIRYNHELLTYLYGPIDDLNYARKQRIILEEIRLRLVLQRPALSDSNVDIIQFSFTQEGLIGLQSENAEDNPYLEENAPAPAATAAP